MIARTHSVKATAVHGLYMAVLFVFAAVSTHSFFYNLKYIQEIDNIIVEIVTAALAALLWGVYILKCVRLVRCFIPMTTASVSEDSEKRRFILNGTISAK